MSRYRSYLPLIVMFLAGTAFAVLALSCRAALPFGFVPTSAPSPTASPTVAAQTLPSPEPTGTMIPSATAPPAAPTDTAEPPPPPQPTRTVEIIPIFSPTPQPTQTPLPATATPIPTTPAVFPDWRGEYFNNAVLSGEPAVVRNDTGLNFDWSSGSPDARLNFDNFSARWTRNQNFEGGLYRFTLYIDDGVRLFVDGTRVLEDWRDAGNRTVSVDVSLNAGVHGLRVEYYERSGLARAQLDIARVNVNTATAIPASTATMTPIPISTATIAPSVTTSPIPASITPVPFASPTPSATNLPTQLPPPTSTPSLTPKPSATQPAPTSTSPSTSTPTLTSTPKTTATETREPTATATVPLAPTSTSESSPTVTPSKTTAATPTLTSTPEKPTAEPTATETATEPVPATPTHTATATEKPTVVVTHTPTLTATITRTPRPTRTATPSGGISAAATLNGNRLAISGTSWAPEEEVTVSISTNPEGNDAVMIGQRNANRNGNLRFNITIKDKDMPAEPFYVIIEGRSGRVIVPTHTGNGSNPTSTVTPAPVPEGTIPATPA